MGRQRAALLAGVVETAAATGTVSASFDEPPPYPSCSRRALPSRALFPRAPGRSASEVKSTQGALKVNSTLPAAAATVLYRRSDLCVAVPCAAKLCHASLVPVLLHEEMPSLREE